MILGVMGTALSIASTRNQNECLKIKQVIIFSTDCVVTFNYLKVTVGEVRVRVGHGKGFSPVDWLAFFIGISMYIHIGRRNTEEKNKAT